MPEAQPVPIAPPPGVVKTESDRTIEGRFRDSQWVRFVRARAQKRGGFTTQTDSANAASGAPRALHAWRTLLAQEYIAAGTFRKLYVYDREFTRHDITPIEATGTLGNNPFTFTSGQSTVTVAHTSHGRNSGDTVILAGATAAHGVTMNGTFTVLTSTANAYVVDAGVNATSSGTGGGNAVTYQYEISVGTEVGTYGLGYGAGGYGLGTYGTARTATTLLIEPRVWSATNYGQLLLAAYNGGTLYQFDTANLATNGRAQAVDNAPTDIRAFFLTEERFPFALREGMEVSWPDQNDITDWTPSESNSANTRTLTDGTKLIGGIALAQKLAMVWSDNAAYLFQYDGSDLVYSDRKVASNCGLIGPQARCVDSNGIAYWMSSHTFHLYNGGVTEIPNVEDIRDFVFKAMRTDQPYLCWTYFDPTYDEVTFFTVPLGSVIPSLSVTYHIKDQVWTPCDWSSFPRTAATRFQHGDVRPYLAAPDGNIALFEDGYNADGAAIAAYVEVAPYGVNDGAQNIELDGIRLDLKDQKGDVALTIDAYDQLIYDDDGVLDAEGLLETVDKTVPRNERLTDVRMGGRYFGIRIESDEVNGYFRWGKPVALINGGGARR